MKSFEINPRKHRVCRLLDRLFLSAWLSLPTAGIAGGQSSPQRPLGDFTIKGFVIDSLRGGPLRNATVRVKGTNLRGVSDSIGRFSILHVPSGPYSLELTHPLLDTLSLTIQTPEIVHSNTDTAFLVLSTPSPSTIIARKCPSIERSSGPAAVMGVVLDADSDEPSTGAMVSLDWTEYVVQNKTLAKIPQRRMATVERDGGFRICGLPMNLVGGLVAARGSDTTATLEIDTHGLLSLASFHVLQIPNASLPRSAQEGLASTGNLSGTIVDIAGRPLGGARVTIYGDTSATVSDKLGKFALLGLRPGTRAVSIRMLGYQSSELVVDISARETPSIVVALSKVTPVLDAVKITAMRDIGLERVGFQERKRLEAGTFLTPRDIEGKNSPRLSRLLETVLILQRYTCVKYFVDGHLWSSRSDVDHTMGPDAYLSGAEIVAVEVYGALTVPPEFLSSSNMGACATVVVWTKWKIAP
jgi:hypothetical protein